MWIPIRINEQSPEPLYHQIEVQLRALIVSGQLAEGTMLPSIRELAQMLKCSIITVRRVYQDLESEGLLRTRQGTGTFVANVAEEERSRHRSEAAIEAFAAAIDAGLRVRFSERELRDVFERVLQEKLKRKEDGE